MLLERLFSKSDAAISQFLYFVVFAIFLASFLLFTVKSKIDVHFLEVYVNLGQFQVLVRKIEFFFNAENPVKY